MRCKDTEDKDDDDNIADNIGDDIVVDEYPSDARATEDGTTHEVQCSEQVRYDDDDDGVSDAGYSCDEDSSQ